MEVENGLSGNVWHWVLVVGYSVVGVLGHDEVCTGGVEHSRLAKVYHSACDTLLKQGHTVEQCESSTERVTRNFHGVGGVKTLKTFDFFHDFGLN